MRPPRRPTGRLPNRRRAEEGRQAQETGRGADRGRKAGGPRRGAGRANPREAADADPQDANGGSPRDAGGQRPANGPSRRRGKAAGEKGAGRGAVWPSAPSGPAAPSGRGERPAGLVVEEVEATRPAWAERVRARIPGRESAPSELSARRRERRAERRRILTRRWSVAGACAAVAVLLVWVVGFSPFLAFRSGDVEVSGEAAGSVPSKDVGRALDGFDGTPLVRLDARAAEAAVKKAVPQVKGADVSRRFPHGLSVRVTARTPVACLQASQGCTAVDAEGVRLSLPQATTAKLPKLRLGGTDAARAAKAMATVLAVLDQPTRQAVDTVSIDGTDQVSFTLRSGATVVWGVARDNERKAAVLRILLKQEAKKYDVSAPNAPVTE